MTDCTSTKEPEASWPAWSRHQQLWRYRRYIWRFSCGVPVRSPSTKCCALQQRNPTDKFYFRLSQHVPTQAIAGQRLDVMTNFGQSITQQGGQYFRKWGGQGVQKDGKYDIPWSYQQPTTTQILLRLRAWTIKQKVHPRSNELPWAPTSSDKLKNCYRNLMSRSMSHHPSQIGINSKSKHSRPTIQQARHTPTPEPTICSSLLRPAPALGAAPSLRRS